MSTILTVGNLTKQYDKAKADVRTVKRENLT
ncbi:MAG: hypothetical protein K0R06_2975 [Clostridium sp.]|jgi:hypothetical protein|nr:hypothetical protein [Clostridium sp.]